MLLMYIQGGRRGMFRCNKGEKIWKEHKNVGASYRFDIILVCASGMRVVYARSPCANNRGSIQGNFVVVDGGHIWHTAKRQIAKHC